MLGNCLWNRKRSNRVIFLATPLLVFIFFSILSTRHGVAPAAKPAGPWSATPLVKKYIDGGHGEGGRWFIPQSWLDQAFDTDKAPPPNPSTVLEAANLALDLAIRNKRMLKGSKIPLIVHQTWRNDDSTTWDFAITQHVEDWLYTAVGPGLSWGRNDESEAEMAYIYWDDSGVDLLIQGYEPNFAGLYEQLPLAIEKADTFRVAVIKWFGGVYADLDTKPLKHPYSWVQEQDLRQWMDKESGESYGLHSVIRKSYVAPAASPPKYQRVLSHFESELPAVGAILGIECDTAPDADDFWRMGYRYPIQLTNWAFAMAPQHPLATRYLVDLGHNIHTNITRLEEVDPLDLTGPPALTLAVKEHCESEVPNFRWNSLGGLDDPPGGRGKIAAGDVLILPITGFSPGRGSFHNMGSQPASNPSARLQHDALGTWRNEGLKVLAGKLCRTVLGRCRDWSKVA